MATDKLVHVIRPQKLTKAAFAPYGDVIETAESDFFMINNDNTQRFHQLAAVDLATAEDKAIISIFRAKSLKMPLAISMLERHPLGSQAFIPLKQNAFLIVVAAAEGSPQSGQIKAFITDGKQGINYHRGVWHHPIVCCEAEDDFLVVDRAGEGNNCDEYFFADNVSISLAP
jgi:ureidoglycolate lyase